MVHRWDERRPAGIVVINARSTAFTASPVSKTCATSGSRRTAMDSGRVRLANRFGLAFPYSKRYSGASSSGCFVLALVGDVFFIVALLSPRGASRADNANPLVCRLLEI